jgi:O-antigen/teichoic acid export membrane protein
MASLTQAKRSPTLGGRRRRLPGLAVMGNLGSRIVAMGALAVVTVLVARAGGPSDVGVLALLRVLPGLAGVLAACGLPSAMGYFIAGPDRDHPQLWPTVIAVMVAGGLIGMLGWFALAPLIQRYFISSTSVAVVAAAGVTVATQLPVAVAKACLQALEDLRGCNVVIAAEEAAFLPAYLLGHLFGLRGPWLIVVALISADVVVAAGAWVRISARVHRSGVRLVGRAEPGLAGRVLRFGLRSQVGGTVGLLNLRLDFLVLGALAGPAAVGIYAVASKYAELLRLPALALTWVTYPRVARMGASTFGPRARRLMAPLLAGGLLVAAALALLAFPLFPSLYGEQFRAAIWPAVIIVCGLVAEPAAGVGSAFLLGAGRPGLNSLMLGAGLVVTLVLDVVLIPAHAAVGAAWASAVAYLLTDVLLILVTWRLTRARP